MELDATISFSETDKLGLNGFCERLEKYIHTEHYFVEGSLVISLNASFGAGKSTFLKMWETDLLNRRESDNKLPIPIILNAWESDYCGDPLIALVSALTEVAESDAGTTEQKKNVKKLREAAKDIAWFTTALANGFVASVTGINPVEAGELAKQKKDERATSHDARPDLLKKYEARVRALQVLKEALEKCFGGDEVSALVFVDELDRCRPDYAVDYLETIKHIFDIRGLAFILAVDKAHLRSSTKALFGSGLNFEEYYRKFVQRNVQLPLPVKGKLNALFAEYFSKYLEVPSIRNCFMSIDQSRMGNIEELVLAYALTPRQIQEVFRVLGHVLSCSAPAKGEVPWGFGNTAVFLSALSVCDVKEYHSLGTGLLLPSDIWAVIKKFSFDEKSARRWMGILMTGYFNWNDEAVSKLLFSEYKNIKLLNPQAGFDAIKQELQRYADGWGWSSDSEDNHVVGIYKYIESLNSLENG